MSSLNLEAIWPYRIFLDSNSIQALWEHGETIYENLEFDATGCRCGADADDVYALQALFHPQFRDTFQYAISGNSLREVSGSDRAGYMIWAFDVMDYWQVCLHEGGEYFQGWGAERARLLDGSGFGYLSHADRALLRDALIYECDTFLTVERRLPRNAAHLARQLGLQVVRPPELWARVIAPRSMRTG